MNGDSAFLTTVGQRTVLDVLRTGARQCPDRELLVFDDLDRGSVSYTWDEVLTRSTGVAAFLTRNAITEGDRVHVHLTNRPEFIFIWFGCSMIGATILPTNINAASQEIRYILDHSRAQISIVEKDTRTNLDIAVNGSPTHRVFDCSQLQPAEKVDRTILGDFDITPGLDLGLLYTSGTTSQPKGVRVTQANYVYAGEVVARNLRLTPDDRVLTVLPLFHANAQYYTIMGSLVARATIVLASRFSARQMLQQVAVHDVTVASLFATPIRMILRHSPQQTWREHKLRAVLFAQNLTEDEHAEWQRSIGAPLLQLYGMTETIGPPLMNPIEDARSDTLGRVSLGYTCRVVGEDGSAAVAGTTGELHVHGIPGVSLMRGYLDDDSATNAAIADGWLRTGDLVRIERGGYLSFVDRQKEMIKISGENVAASEVEHVLRSHPQVRAAAVFGLPDPVHEERLVATVVAEPAGPLPDAQQLRTWCAERLAKFRVPSEIDFVQELPVTAVGKVQKHVLRAARLDREAGTDSLNMGEESS